MIELKKLNRVFRTADIETIALNSINLEISATEFLAVMGPSGCGKSTLLNILGLLDSPTSGQFIFEGVDIAGYKESDLSQIRKGHLGYIFQDFHLIDDLTVFQNVEVALLYLKVPKKERVELVHQVLNRVGLSHRTHHMPAQLSGGQQQRVAIARALVSDPKIILADEPTGNLDSANSTEVMTLLQEMNERGTSIVMVTHSTEDAAFASRTITLADGSIIT